MIENLKNKNRDRIVVAAYRSKYFRQPNQSEIRIWKEYLVSGHTISEMLLAMAGRNCTKPLNPQLTGDVDIGFISITESAKDWAFSGAEGFLSLFEKQLQNSTEAIFLQNYLDA